MPSLPTLYLVATPIGNLGDISERALQTLNAVDFIAAEDTRVSLKLLRRFGIKKPVVSYYEHNARHRGEQIVKRILSGESCAVVTDAGMPCISDPGEGIVSLCAKSGICVSVVPGACAAVSALAVSGLAAGRFAFEGFLSVNKTSRAAHLDEIKRDTRTLIFYEAPHKLPATLRDMHRVLGDRRISLARELTKLHEEVLRTTLSEALLYYTENQPRGEFVLIVEGAAPEKPERPAIEDALEKMRALVEAGEKPAAAAKEAARETGWRKNELYEIWSRGKDG